MRVKVEWNGRENSFEVIQNNSFLFHSEQTEKNTLSMKAINDSYSLECECVALLCAFFLGLEGSVLLTLIQLCFD